VSRGGLIFSSQATDTTTLRIGEKKEFRKKREKWKRLPLRADYLLRPTPVPHDMTG
jgi:hypothetical protein